jgi:ComF family protein
MRLALKQSVPVAIGSLSTAALDLVFPRRCAVCGAYGPFVCEACEAELEPAVGPRCPRCWAPGADGAECLACQASPPAFDGLRAAFVYKGAARELVLALKFKNMSVVAESMGELLAVAASRNELGVDIAVPVPLAGRRARVRGYNQAELLAQSLARELALPPAGGALRRMRNTPAQAKSADAETRRRNVEGAFACRRPEAIAGRRVLLVDDVTTTGATLSACAAALKDGGAASVWALAFARED